MMPKPISKSRHRFVVSVLAGLCALGAVMLSGLLGDCEYSGPFSEETRIHSGTTGARGSQGTSPPSVPSVGTITDKGLSPQEAGLKSIEDTIRDIRIAGEKAESRTYYVKLIGNQLVDLVQVAVGILLLIAIGFPLAVWFLVRKGVLDFSGRSASVATALIEVEERQAKLVAIFKDLQDEVEILNTGSSPDLSHLIQRAKQYIEENERDLATISVIDPQAGKGNVLKQ